MYFSNLSITAATLAAVGTFSSLCFDVVQAAADNNGVNNENNNNNNKVVMMQRPSYDPAYLASLTAEERVEAMKPEVIMNDDVGNEVLYRSLSNGQHGFGFAYEDHRSVWRMNNGKQLTLAPLVPSNVKYCPERKISISDQDYWFREGVHKWFTDTHCTSSSSEGSRSVFEEIDEALLGNTTTRQPGYLENIYKTGEYDLSLVQADLRIVGFFSGEEFPYFAARPHVLALSAPVFYYDENGNLTDIDNDGKFDIAFVEIYFNSWWNWSTKKLDKETLREKLLFDFPTLLLHEIGHVLGLDHFGSLMVHNDIHSCKPSSVMCEEYVFEAFHELGQVDSHGFCSIWDDSPFLLDG